MRAWTIAICISLLGSTLTAQAPDDASGPTRFVHQNANQEAVRRLYTDVYVPAREVPQNWKDLGNCNPGTLSPATLKARLAEINFFRKMAGLGAVTLDAEMNKKAQAAAFLMTQNGSLNHHPPTTWKCYTELAAAGAGSSNLGYGQGIAQYMTDFGANNEDCGHRMWILKARAKSMGYGGTEANSAISVFGPSTTPDSLPQYVAWPPSGFVPSELVTSRWTFSVPGEYVNYNDATVQVSLDGKSIPLIYTQYTSYGDGGLAFEIKDWETWDAAMKGEIVRVVVKNITVGDETRSFTYEVAPFQIYGSGSNAITFYNDNASDGDENVTAEEPAEVAFPERKLMTLSELVQATELHQLTFDELKPKVAKDLVFNEDFCKFAAQVSKVRKDKKPDPVKLNAWAAGKIKAYLARQAGLDEAQTLAAETPKFLLVEITRLIPIGGQESFGEIATELAAKFVENPDLKAFALKYKRVRQCGIGLAVKRVDRNGQTYAGVYATLVLSPASLRVSG